jgi:hypothetical protein
MTSRWTQTSYMRHAKASFFWFPVLVPGYPALFIAGRNVGEYRGAELLGILGALLLSGTLIHTATHRLLRQRTPPSTIALVSTTLGGWLFVSTAVTEELRQHFAPARAIAAPTSVLLGAALVAVVIGWLLSHRGDLTGLRRAVGLMIYVLVGVAAVRLGWNATVATYRVQHSSFIHARLALPSAQDGSGAPPAHPPQRDIYLIIVDKYASAAVLREYFGYSTAPFEAALRRLGFVVPTDSRSNYDYTWLSLASMLNFEHIAGVQDSLGGAERLGLRVLIEQNRTVTFLKQNGYRFYFFPSHLFVATRHDPRADVEFTEPLERAPFRATVSRSQMAHTVWSMSVPGVLGQYLGFDLRYPEQELQTFRGMERLAAEPGPKLVLAHVMVTHEPFFFDGECHLRELVGRAEPDGPAYVDTVKCVNKLLLDLVTSILARSAVPPVILTQGDHGVFVSKTLGKAAGEAPGDRFRAFAAYYLPDGGSAALDPATTPVNLLRFVFGYYFGAHLPLRPNQSFRMGYPGWTP